MDRVIMFVFECWSSDVSDTFNATLLHININAITKTWGDFFSSMKDKYIITEIKAIDPYEIIKTYIKWMRVQYTIWNILIFIIS